MASWLEAVGPCRFIEHLSLINASSVVFDTGSYDIIFPSTDCTTKRGCTNPVSFDSARSSTYQSSKKSWGPIQFGTGIGVGVGSAATPSCAGIIAQDTISIAGLAVSNQSVGLITQQSPDLFGSSAIQGIFGMGPSSKDAFGRPRARSGSTFVNALVAQRKLPKAVFSLFLTPKKIGNAEMTLGGIDESKVNGKINYLPVSRRGDWNIRFQSITVNGRRTNIRPQIAIADSGTSNMIAPTEDATAIYSLISPNIKMLDPENAYGAYGIPCSEIPALNATIAITMGNQTYTIPSQELSVGPFPGFDGMCQTLINSMEQKMWIIGASLMKYYYTIWDMEASRMGWAKTTHSPA